MYSLVLDNVEKAILSKTRVYERIQKSNIMITSVKSARYRLRTAMVRKNALKDRIDGSVNCNDEFKLKGNEQTLGDNV